MSEIARIVQEKVRKVDVKGLEAALRKRVNGEVRFDTGSLALYATDGSNYRHKPIGVVIPKGRASVQAAVMTCSEFGAPIISRGCGTGLAGQTCGAGVIIDHSKYLNHVLSIDGKNRTAVVEPGTILDRLRELAQRGHSLTFAPDPATHRYCTLGGMLGNDSCGVHSVMGGPTGGRTADNVQEMEVLTADGIVMRVGPVGEQELNAIIAAGGRKGAIYRTMKEIRDQYGDLIRARYPKIPRRVSGYNLDELLPENGFNVARALVGTESTCVTILEATLKLIYSPPKRALLVLGYPDVYSAADHVVQIMQFKPTALEGMDSLLVHFMKLMHLHPKDVALLPRGGGWLIVEFGGETDAEAVENAKRCMESLKHLPDAPSMKLFDDPAEVEAVWIVRESGLGATANVPGQPLQWDGWEDAAIPPAKLGNYLREFRTLLDKHGYVASLYGHFGQGCVHCRISFDFFTQKGIDNYMSFIDEGSDLVVKYGGSFSAEHGDGQSKAVFLPKMYGNELVEAFWKFKTAWDPENIMNPGKIVHPYLPDENLRLGTDYHPLQPATAFKFPDDEGSYSRATLRCVGVGKCRRTVEAFMCPSFLVTHEERHTTRGRAHTLFEMMRGDIISSGWDSQEAKEALELCLGCKACKKDCPVHVDIDQYKTEFHYHYYQKHARPAVAYLMGFVGNLASLGARMSRTANFFVRAPVLSDIAKSAAGIAPQRQIPELAPETFKKWYSRNDPGLQAGNKKVVLYADAFNNFFYPHTLQAAYLVLRNWGYDVIVPPGGVPEPRPLLHYGFVADAKKEIQRGVEQVRQHIRDGIAVVFCEPSSCSVYRDEVPSLYPSDSDMKLMSEQSLLLSEFIDREKLMLPSLKGKAIFHGHCHQRAVLNPDAARNILRKMGLEFEEPQKTCCGMAGSFGYEKDKYELSMQIAELGLFPAIRRAPVSWYIVADGFSCRTQIKDGTGRTALHTGELLLLALRDNATKNERLIRSDVREIISKV
jgi:FAD/FMN-containing dehydrogenase/Fe-S oxidoreductase